MKTVGDNVGEVCLDLDIECPLKPSSRVMIARNDVKFY